MNVTIEWVLSALIGILIVVVGALFKMHLDNRDRLDRHEVILAGMSHTDGKIDEIRDAINDRFDRHEEKEDRVLGEMKSKIEKLLINVALLKKSPNGDREDA